MGNALGVFQDGYFSSPPEGILFGSTPWELGKIPGGKTPEDACLPTKLQLQGVSYFSASRHSAFSISSVPPAALLQVSRFHFASLHAPTSPNFGVTGCPENSFLWWVEEELIFVLFSFYLIVRMGMMNTKLSIRAEIALSNQMWLLPSHRVFWLF